MIAFACQACGQRYQVKEELGGRRVKCKSCQQVIAIPTPAPVGSEVGRHVVDPYGFEEPTAPVQRRESNDYGLADPPPSHNPYAAPSTEPELYPKRMADPGNERRTRSRVPAGFLYRVGASFLDTIIVFILALAGGFLFGVSVAMSGIQMTQGQFILLGNFVGILVTVGYHALLNAGPGQATLGKRALGLLVVDEHGQQISLGRSIGRELAKMTPTLLIIFIPEAGRPIAALIYLVGYGITLTNEQRQSLFDMIAGVYVVFRK